jgi:hypothetical protein
MEKSRRSRCSGASKKRRGSGKKIRIRLSQRGMRSGSLGSSLAGSVMQDRSSVNASILVCSLITCVMRSVIGIVAAQRYNLYVSMRCLFNMLSTIFCRPPQWPSDSISLSSIESVPDYEDQWRSRRLRLHFWLNDSMIRADDLLSRQ